MDYKWSLDALYTGFEDEHFLADWKKLEELCTRYQERTACLGGAAPAAEIRAVLELQEELEELAERLGIYAGLRQAADTKDTQSASVFGRLKGELAEIVGAQTAFRQFVAKQENLDAIIASDPVLTEYRYLLTNIRKDSRYLLEQKEEEIMARMDLSGASAWEELQAYLTSSVQVEFRGKTTTLSAIRNLAYDPDPATRREAYEAELKCYPKIADPVAFSLNSIKLQMLNDCRLRGYESPLQRALYDARMERKTLDSMFAAIDEYLPKFWAYLRGKAKALGHENGMPWYDMFAPMGENNRKYSVEDARELLLRLFGGFDEALRAMVQEAFDHDWIDFFPREGKVGGAFCQGIQSIRQSRILTNFDGTYSDIVTLAHELGHAFHNVNLYDHRPLNKEYSMPVAETASTFNENIVNNAAYAAAQTDGERLAILESQLMDACQIICDIYSRYLFETEVFAHREEQFLPAERLCEMMLEAQKKAYGDGLDQNFLHPYMWLCKSHYYSGSLSFYNFPYAFGGLFARGLYARYREEGAAFVPKYKALLHATSVMSAEDAAAIAGIDLTDRRFWESSLESISRDIDEFLRLLEKN